MGNTLAENSRRLTAGIFRIFEPDFEGNFLGQMADEIGASQAARELAEAAGRDANYVNRAVNDEDGYNSDVNETIGGVFDMSLPSSGGRSRRTTSTPRRAQQRRQPRGKTGRGGKQAKNASPAPAPAEPQPGPSGRGHGRGRGGRKRGRGRAPANATATVACSHPGTSSMGGDGAERGAAVAPTGSIIPGPTWDSGSVEPKKPKDEKTTAKGENDKVDGEKKEVKAEEDKSESDVRPDSQNSVIDIDNVQSSVEISSSNNVTDKDEDNDDDVEYVSARSDVEDYDSSGSDRSCDLEGLSGDDYDGAREIRPPPESSAALLKNDSIRKKMENMFKSSLDLAAEECYLQAAEGVTTPLYPHQMRAIYWMSQRENKFEGRDGVTGGILADDMGLGKTLTVLSLIVTNFHDQRPLARPESGYSRAKNRTGSVIRYMPSAYHVVGSAKRKGKKGKSLAATVQARLDARKGGTDLFGFLGGGRKKDMNGKVKSSSAKTIKAAAKPINFGDEGDDSNDESEDEFGSMCNEKSGTLSERMGLSSSDGSELFNTNKNKHFFDGLSSDEEYNNMSDRERNERMKKGLKDSEDFTINLDGATAEPASETEDSQGDGEEDEFGSMCNEKSTPLSERLGLSPEEGAGLFATHRDNQTQKENGRNDKAPNECDEDEDLPLKPKSKRKLAILESSD